MKREAPVPSREWQRLPEQQKQIIREHQNDFPIQLAPLARALGIRVQASTLAPGISGELRPDGAGGFVIRVNRHDAPVRQRFTVAHEIAHFLLHRDHIGGGIRDDVLYRSALSDAREAEANRLAADILMPEDNVWNSYRRQRGRERDEAIMELSQQFGVSESAMKIRLDL
jgi:Zn-dependent peptidase ImmA (M78 family)